MPEFISRFRKVCLPSEKYRFFLLTAALTAGAFLELAGLGSVLPVIAAFVDVHCFEKGGYLVRLRELFPSLDDVRFLILLAVLVALFYLLKNALLYLLARLQIRYSFGVAERAACDLMEKYFRTDFAAVSRRNPTELLELVQQTRTTFAETLNGMMMILSECITVGVIFLAMFLASPGTTAAIAVVLGLFSVLVYLPVRHLMERVAARIFHSDQALFSFVLLSMESLREVKLSSRRKFFEAEGRLRMHRTMDNCRLTLTYAQIPRFLIESAVILCGMGCIAVLLLLGVRSASVAMSVSFLGLGLLRMMPSFSRIHYYLARVKGFSDVFRRICEDLEHVLPEALPPPSEQAVFSLKREFVFEQVSFRYPGAGSGMVLNGLSFRLPACSSLALAGPTGCGKSTALDLAAGLLFPSSGRILSDGTEIRTSPEDWRKLVGYVPQNVHIADASICENVAFGLPKEQIDRKRVEEVLRLACALDFCRELPQGLNTVPGENGRTLSGGQRQRIGIARALYPRPQLLLLDEATSALDDRTEQEFLQTLRSLKGHCTILVAAHRPAAIALCDHVIRFPEKNG